MYLIQVNPRHLSMSMLEELNTSHGNQGYKITVFKILEAPRTLSRHMWTGGITGTSKSPGFYWWLYLIDHFNGRNLHYRECMTNNQGHSQKAHFSSSSLYAYTFPTRSCPQQLSSSSMADKHIPPYCNERCHGGKNRKELEEALLRRDLLGNGRRSCLNLVLLCLIKS